MDTTPTPQYERPEKTYLCQFALDTSIYDTQLPCKIGEKLAELALSPNAGKHYCIDVSFDANAYNEPEFYRFPVESKPWQTEQLKSQSPKQQTHTLIREILSQQLRNICAQLPAFSIPYTRAAIAGEDLETPNLIYFRIYEDNFSPAPQPTQRTSRKRQTQAVVISIIPHRPSLVKRATQVIAEQVLRKMQEENRKEQELAARTPNLLEARRLFTALAAAVLEEIPREYSTPESLGYELAAHSRIQNDWPLEILGDQGLFFEDAIPFSSQIDCPELLVCTFWKKHWSIKKANELNAAKIAILFDGYNRKTVEQVIVLRNLVPVPFTLFVEEHGEIRPIPKAEAHTAKRLFLQWT